MKQKTEIKKGAIWLLLRKLWNYVPGAGLVKIHDGNETPRYIPPYWPEEEGICFMACESPNNECGAMALKRCIANKIILPDDVIKADDIEVAEFAGLVATLKTCKERRFPHTIYTESEFAVTGVKSKGQVLNFKKKNLSANDLELVRQAMEWLRTNEHNDCRKWHSDWGAMQFYLMGEKYYAD